MYLGFPANPGLRIKIQKFDVKYKRFEEEEKIVDTFYFIFEVIVSNCRSSPPGSKSCIQRKLTMPSCGWELNWSLDINVPNLSGDNHEVEIFESYSFTDHTKSCIYNTVSSIISIIYLLSIGIFV